MTVHTPTSGAGQVLILTPSDLDRFWSKVSELDENGCRMWLAGKTSKGYGMFWLQGMQRLAHRVAYAVENGTLPEEGMVLDHICRNRLCVAIAHLDLVTQRENVLRGDLPALGRAIRTNWTVCKNGHDVTDPANVHVYASGQQACRICKRNYAREWARQKRARDRS